MEDGFVFEDGGGELAHLDVGLGDALGGADDILFAIQLGVSFLENFERLIVVGLCLSDSLKHLDRLNDLIMFLVGERVFQHGGR